MAQGRDRSCIPDYRTYRVEDAPELLEIQEALRQKGLKDPWMRNEVWRFLPSEWGTHRQRLLTFFFRGFRLGLGAFLATIALEGIWKLKKKATGDGGHGGGDDGACRTSGNDRDCNYDGSDDIYDNGNDIGGGGDGIDIGGAGDSGSGDIED